MIRGLRFLKDVLWVLVWMALALLVYRLAADPAEPGALDGLLFLGVIAAVGIAVISASKAESNLKDPNQAALFESESGMWMGTFRDSPSRVSFTAILGVPLAGLIIHAGAFAAPAETMAVKPPRAKDDLRHVLVLNGDRDADAVEFNHDMHQELLGREDSCVKCHHIHKPADPNSDCSGCHKSMVKKTSIFSHNLHQQKLGGNGSCKECHDPAKAKTPQTAKACAKCHADNMKIETPEEGPFNYMAPSYPNALHGFCLSCHRQKERQEGMRGLSGCGTCHKNAEFEKKLLP
ncbi:MAG: cytochrome c3 family protein [bacterium]